jgi:hypothetical protein
MQSINIRNRYLQVFGLQLMRRIKNDLKSYLRRSDLFSKNKNSASDKNSDYSHNRELEFATAPIDQSGYINFQKPQKRPSRR